MINSYQNTRRYTKKYTKNAKNSNHTLFTYKHTSTHRGKRAENKGD